MLVAERGSKRHFLFFFFSFPVEFSQGMPFEQALQNIYSLGINIISVLILDHVRKSKAHFWEFGLFQEGRELKSEVTDYSHSASPGNTNMYHYRLLSKSEESN